MIFDDWLTYGLQQGWIGEPVCITHDGIDLTPEEEAAIEAGEDPCVSALRLWPRSEA